MLSPLRIDPLKALEEVDGFKRKLDLHQLTFALGEAIAHLHGLWFDGKLERIAGADGVFRFAPA